MDFVILTQLTIFPNMKYLLGLFGIMLMSITCVGQQIEAEIEGLNAELDSIQIKKRGIEQRLEVLKLQRVRRDLTRWGLPRLEAGETVIAHSAMCLVYDEYHEQAKWVAHIITPDIIQGSESRSNDFRQDPKVPTASSEEKDYFLKFLKADSSYEYDGFGYDRGHLAPSADFRWSRLALSESYFYSNMSPQRPEFNRGGWAQLEGLLREYIFRNEGSQLMVVTGPVLKDDLPKVARSVNGVSIPAYYFKVVVDRSLQRGIAFLMPNKEIIYPLPSFAVSIDSVEALTGIDFFPALDDRLETLVEQSVEPKPWLPQGEQSDVAPINLELLPKNHFNTVQARFFADRGEKVRICGTVVSTKLSRNGHVFINLDKKFPNQIFSATIWKDSRVNFSYEPHLVLMGQKVCLDGEIRLTQGVPTMNLKNEKALKFFDED